MYLNKSFIIAAVLLSACTKSNYITAPAKVETPQGVVTCQLYTKERVLWDEAMAKPANMTDEQAHAICRNEGLRQKNS